MVKITIEVDENLANAAIATGKIDVSGILALIEVAAAEALRNAIERVNALTPIKRNNEWLFAWNDVAALAEVKHPSIEGRVIPTRAYDTRRRKLIAFTDFIVFASTRQARRGACDRTIGEMREAIIAHGGKP